MMADTALRRAKIVQLSLDEFIRWMCDSSYWRVVGIPKDAKVIGAHYDLVTNSLEFAIESDSFDGTPHGERLPYLDFVVQRLNPD